MESHWLRRAGPAALIARHWALDTPPAAGIKTFEIEDSKLDRWQPTEMGIAADGQGRSRTLIVSAHPAKSLFERCRLMIAQSGFVRTVGVVFSAGVLAALSANSVQVQSPGDLQPDSYSANNRPPDTRFKADILLVVAHPDDETLVSSYLAREIFDQHKRVAVVYGTHGDGGNNQVGPEQAVAMGQIREIEGRQAESSLGVTNVWFLTGRDTASQNVLNSLERWGHGSCLDQLVRIVRMTRPSVVLTFLPDFTTGENHADHQAAGVLATEAFDMAGDPTVFSEQTSPVSNPDKAMNLTEGLRPWQPEKIYYFYNPTHDIFAGQGPQYSAKDISPAHHASYGMLAAEAYAHHRTQGGNEVQRAIDNHTLDSSPSPEAQMVTDTVRFIFGKSLVPSGVTDDVFAGVVPGGISFQRAPGFDDVQPPRPTLEIGDPWNYYRKLWKAHGLDHLSSIVPLEVTVKVGGDALVIPLVIDNPSSTTVDVTLSVQAPNGWETRPISPVTVEAHSRYYLRIQAAAPTTKLPGWQQFTVSAQSGNESIGTVPVRVELSTGWVAPQ